MPTARRSRTVAAPPEQLWEVVSDPHHLPRWWPRVTRVEDVEDGAFTEVMRTEKGKLVRADFQLVEVDPLAHRLRWEQRLEGTPFSRLLSAAETELTLEPAGEGTTVSIELRQKLKGVLARFGGFMVRRAAIATIDEALEGLTRISG
ncbi:MAG: SRPBCC family protein [Actinobacteria bacterium]|nr:MAG: SRPBCC family protein [Actinomycetota bacterium]